MLKWLFKRNKSLNEKTKFSALPIDQQFQKTTWDERIYVKTDDSKYQTTNDITKCNYWFIVNEDFEVKPII